MATSNSITLSPTVQTELPLSIIDDEPRVDSRLLAEQLGVTHQTVMKLVAKYIEKFQGHGILGFQIQVTGERGQPEKYALLNESQSYFLLTLVRNTDQAVNLKDKLVKSFKDCRDRLERKKTPEAPLSLDEKALNRFECLLKAGALMQVPLHILHQESAKLVFLETSVDYRPLVTYSPSQNINAEDRMLEPDDLAKYLGVSSGRKLNPILEAMGWQYKQGTTWIPTDEGRPHCKDHTWIRGGKTGNNLKWNVNAVEQLYKNYQETTNA